MLNDPTKICIVCKRPAHEHCYSNDGHLEVGISGMCEECFDECTKEPEDS